MQCFYRDIYQEEYEEYNYNCFQSAYQKEKDQKEFFVEKNEYDEYYKNEYDDQNVWYNYNEKYDAYQKYNQENESKKLERVKKED